MKKELKKNTTKKGKTFVETITDFTFSVKTKFQFTAGNVAFYCWYNLWPERLLCRYGEDYIFTDTNFYVHGSDSRILNRFKETDYKLMPAMDLLSGKGVSPSSGEMTNFSVDQRMQVCFGRLKPPVQQYACYPSYDIDYIMENYSGRQVREACCTRAEIDKESFENDLQEFMYIEDRETGKLVLNKYTIFPRINVMLIGLAKMMDRGIFLNPELLSDFENMVKKVVNYFHFLSLFDGLLDYDDDYKVLREMFWYGELSVFDIGDAVNKMEDDGFDIKEKLDCLDNVKYLYIKAQTKAAAAEEAAAIGIQKVIRSKLVRNQAKVEEEEGILAHAEDLPAKEEKVVKIELLVAKAEGKSEYLDGVSIRDVAKERFSKSWTWEDIYVRLKKMRVKEDDIFEIKANFDRSIITDKELKIINSSFRKTTRFEIVRYLYIKAKEKAKEKFSKQSLSKLAEEGAEYLGEASIKNILDEPFSNDWSWNEINRRLEKIFVEEKEILRIKESFHNSTLVDGILLHNSYDLFVSPQEYDITKMCKKNMIRDEEFKIAWYGEEYSEKEIKESDVRNLRRCLYQLNSDERAYKKKVDTDYFYSAINNNSDFVNYVLLQRESKEDYFVTHEYRSRVWYEVKGINSVDYFDNRGFCISRMLSRYKSGYFASKTRKPYFLYMKRLNTLQGLIERNKKLGPEKLDQKPLDQIVDQLSVKKGFPLAFLVDDEVACEKKLRIFEDSPEYRSQGSYRLGKDIKRVVTDSKEHAYELFRFFKKSGLKDVKVYTRDQLDNNKYVNRRPGKK